MSSTPMVENLQLMPMSVEEVVFYAFAALTLTASVLLIRSRNPVHAALFLVMAFVSCAGVWVLLHAEFLGIALILVYVGAVMVLFLFVVMMLDINVAVLREGFTNYLPVGLLVALIVFSEIVIILNREQFDHVLSIGVEGAITAGSNTKLLGRLLYTEHLYSVELAAILLTIAIVAAIALTLRRGTSGSAARYQKIAEQVKVSAKDRVRMVDMSAASERHQNPDRAAREGED